MRRGNSSIIDVDHALDLWDTYKNWNTVASHMLRVDGRPFTAMSVYLAVWRVDRLPDGGKRKRPSREERDMTETSLAHIWRPGKEKILPVRPDYKTNRVVPNEAAP